MKILKIMFMMKSNTKMAFQVNATNKMKLFVICLLSLVFILNCRYSPFPDEYDHLDYSSRPSSSFIPHYHRMNYVLNITKDEKEVKESNIESNNLDAPGKMSTVSKASFSSGDSNSLSCINDGIIS